MQQPDVTWSVPSSFVPALLQQAWYLLLVAECCEEDVPAPVWREVVALRAMTEEYAIKSPLPRPEQPV